MVRYLLKNQDFAACKKLLAESLLHNPSWDGAYVHLATVHIAQGEMDKAIACIQKALAIAPHNIQAQEMLSSYLSQSGKHEEAIEILAKALQNNPRHAERYAQNARIFEHMGNIPKAIEYAKKAVEMEPRNFVCKMQLATYLRKNKEYDAVIELMTEAMHSNPFWSEPHAQFAAIYDEKGELDKAIDCARKAVAVEPFDALRKQELLQYRLKRAQTHKNEQINPNRLSHTCARIQSYIDIFYAKTYLEIGVENGHTFLNIDVPFKMGVDPLFLFDTSLHAHAHAHFYKETSDTFFEKLPQRATKLQEIYHNKAFAFDIIFIDGLHTFEQTLRDFENSLAFAHENTIWIIDDTVPCNYFSAMTSREKCISWRSCAGLSKEPEWHGDVFKVIFAIHDMHPEFSYCTQLNKGNPQTILWRSQEPNARNKVFSGLDDIARMRYEDFVEHAWVLYPVNDEEVLEKIFSNINPIEYRTGEEYKKIIHPLISDQEKIYKKHIEELKKDKTLLSEGITTLHNDLEYMKNEYEQLVEQHTTLYAENVFLKRKLAECKK